MLIKELKAKIRADLKSRTKRKIAENQRRLSATGGDVKGSCPKWTGTRTTPTIQPTMAALSPTTTPPVLSQSSSTITASLLTETPIINSPPMRLFHNRWKRNFQDAIVTSAKVQAEANKIQAESSKK
ncbi:unnamed protein product [Ceratitis capitata]|uniref:(Mediterranean fruit fly) hypothetical protein n=1 Tax=Ceratitis capitata TaxID=7213 RepID=A0A811UNY6_CERCA|nr:unnamed protein product [Ceratitis capitata]